MRKTTSLQILLAAVVGAALGGCSSGLKYKVDEGALDSVSANERQGVFQAQNEVEVARSEQRNADKQLELFGHEGDIAKKEKQQATLEVEKAQAEQEAANQARDENRANSARHAKEAAEIGVKASDQKLSYLEQKEDWLKAVKKAAEAHQTAAQAKTEFEKAKVAQQKGIKMDADFNVSKYEDQWKDKNDDWESAKKDASSQESKTKDREKQWQELVAQQKKMQG